MPWSRFETLPGESPRDTRATRRGAGAGGRREPDEGKDPDVVACIQSMDCASAPSPARNNLLHCDHMLLGSNPVRIWKTVMQLEDGLGQDASDNLKLSQVLVTPEDDMLLDAQSAAR